MQNTVRTVYDAYLQSCRLLNLPITIPVNSTLNQKFNIHNGVTISDSDKPTLNYVTLGNGGHRMVAGVDNIPLPILIPHTPRHAALYNHIPFILRTPANDLSPTDRANYRLRRLETHHSVQYVAYYLKVLNKATTIPQLELRSVNQGIVTATPFTASLGDLSPTIPPNLPSGVLTTTGDYIAATAKLPFTLSPDEVTELLNVCNIIYQNPNYAMISEIALCSGVDRTLMGNFNGNNSSYTDAVAVQVNHFINQFIHLPSSNSGVNITLDVGSVEPLLSLT